MSYGGWGRPKVREERELYEKAFRRAGLAAWDGRWHGLAPSARRAFLDRVKGPVRTQGPGGAAPQPSVGADGFEADDLQALVEAGLVVVAPAGKKGGPDRVAAVPDAYDFAARLRALRKHRPLFEGTGRGVAAYYEAISYAGRVAQAFSDVLRKAGIDDYLAVDAAIGRYVLTRHWPGWVARSLNTPLAARVVEAARAAGGPVPIVELARGIKGDPDDVRRAIDRLVGLAALGEDLDPETSDVVVDFLPGVRAALDRADRPRARPSLVAVEAAEVGPEGGFFVHDLRAFLLEIAGDPPRLRQDKAFFQKEVDRFLAALDPLPTWLTDSLDWTPAERVEQAHAWARLMALVEEAADGKQVQLALSTKGERWLAGPLEDQFASLFGLLGARVDRNRVYDPEHWFFYKDVYDVYSYADAGPSDYRFLGDNVTAIRKTKGSSRYYVEATKEDVEALREALFRAFSGLNPGTSYRLEDVLGHAVFGESNPLLLGLGPDEVVVYRNGRRVPPLEELLEEAGAMMLRVFLGVRLIPLGCLATAIDGEGRFCVARTPRLDAYFGREVAPSDLAGVPAGGEAKVVVQPDFSVVVIGTSPAPAAALAPFCERSTKGSGQGAMVLKLTRESVVKAVANGLTPEEIVDRLKKYASNDVPANVLREVEEWSDWVRWVTLGTMTVLRCPDAAVADRVVAALKKGAERINETIVAVDGAKLSTADRAKFRDRGLIVQGHIEPAAKAAKKKKAKRRW